MNSIFFFGFCCSPPAVPELLEVDSFDADEGVEAVLGFLRKDSSSRSSSSSSVAAFFFVGSAKSGFLKTPGLELKLGTEDSEVELEAEGRVEVVEDAEVELEIVEK